MKRVITFIALSAFIISCANEPAEDETLKTEKMETELTNKEKAVALLTSLETGDQTPVSYINPDKYIQHNLAIGDGLEGFGALLKNAPEGGFKAKVVRSFEDGDYVFTHTEYDFFGDQVGFDVFRFEDGLIVEHWDNLLAVAPANPSGHTQTDGPTEISDLSKTVENKALVKDFVQTILVNGEFDKLSNYFDGNNYIQHNPAIADGLSGLAAGIEHMASQGISMVYNTTHIVLGEGNFC